MKKGVSIAARMTESEFKEGLLAMLDVYSKFKVAFDWSESEFEEIFEGIFRGFIFGVEMLVIRLEGNKGFVFISSIDEFFKFLKKRYGGFEKLLNEYDKKGGGKEISRRHVLVLSEGEFKRFLRWIESDIRRITPGRIDISRHIITKIEWWWGVLLSDYKVCDGILFKYNKRWVEILPEGGGDYRTLVEFLEDEFGSLINWLKERPFKGYVVRVE